MTIDTGKTAEYLFAAEVLGRGLVPFWPSTAMGAIDLVVCNEARATRIQVKASMTSDNNSYKVGTKMKENGRVRAYTSTDVDIIAVHLFDLEVWYLIPIRSVKGMGIYIRPEDPKCPYAKYKEAWALLR